MSLEIGALAMGLLAIGIAIKPFPANIKKRIPGGSTREKKRKNQFVDQ